MVKHSEEPLSIRVAALSRRAKSCREKEGRVHSPAAIAAECSGIVCIAPNQIPCLGGAVPNPRGRVALLCDQRPGAFVGRHRGNKRPRERSSAQRIAWGLFQITILAAMASLIVGLLWRHATYDPEPSQDMGVRNGNLMKRDDLPAAPRPRMLLDDPMRVRQLLQSGSTYLVRSKGGFVARTQRSPSGRTDQVRNLACAFEAVFTRTIRRNDGRRIVEDYHFTSVRTARLTSDRLLELELGSPDKPLLETIKEADGFTGTKPVAIAPVADAVLKGGWHDAARNAADGAVLAVDTLSGKTVRITFVDGVGVDSIKPLGCDLTDAELTYLFSLPVVGDAYIVPRKKMSGPPGNCLIPGELLASLLGPAMHGSRLCDTVIRPARSLDPQTEADDIHFQFENRLAQPNDRCAWSPQGMLRADSDTGRIKMTRLAWPIDSRSLQAFRPMLLGITLEGASQFTFTYACTTGGPAPAALPEQPIWDLSLGVLLVIVLSVGLAGCGWKLARIGSPKVCTVVSVVATVFMIWFGSRLHGDLWLASVLPVSNVIVLANLLPLGAGFLSGVLLAQGIVPFWRRTAMVVILIALGGYSVLCDLTLNTIPTSRSWFRGGVCLQTLPETCSPCSAATLLAWHGIAASEAEMSRLCLTRKQGTPILGLYRGLKLKTRGTRWDVEAFRGSVEELRSLSTHPVLLRLRSTSSSLLDWPQHLPTGTESPAAEHSVVLLSFTPDGQVEVADPANNRSSSTWPLEELTRRWSGEGMRLVARGKLRRQRERANDGPHGPDRHWLAVAPIRSVSNDAITQHHADPVRWQTGP